LLACYYTHTDDGEFKSNIDDVTRKIVSMMDLKPQLPDVSNRIIGRHDQLISMEEGKQGPKAG